jgi:hypothetical protein
MDEPIEVELYPLKRAFQSIQAAVAHAMSHPCLPDARRDGEKLAGSCLVDACWTLRAWTLRFDNGYCLGIWPDGSEVRWHLSLADAQPDEGIIERVGALPRLLRWPGWIGVRPMDCSLLIAKRRGASFERLFINDYGLFVYFRGLLILQFYAVRRVADGESMLFVCEDT